MFGAPEPRFRIYTDALLYAKLLGEFVLTNRFSSGDEVEALELELSRLLNVRHAIMTPTARTGIYLALLAIIKPGQKVILSPVTIVDVVNMVICAGGIPVFADVEPNTCNIDPIEIEKLIDKDTGAVLVTHLHGLACDIQKIKTICDTHGVPLLEDAAQAFSTHVNSQWVGTFGRAGIFSFGMYKIVNAFYGGMVVTNDDDLARTLRRKIATFPVISKKAYLSKAFHGLTTDISTSPLIFSLLTYWLFRFGYLHDISAINGFVTVDRFPRRKNSLPANYLVRMSPGQAKLIHPQLRNVERNNRRRIETALLYHDGLSSIPNAILPPRRDDGTHIYTYFAFRAPDRGDLMRFAMEKRRDMVLSHYHNCADLDIFRDFYRPCPHAAATARELLYLPTYPRYANSEIHKNVDVIQAYFKQSSIQRKHDK